MGQRSIWGHLGQRGEKDTGVKMSNMLHTMIIILTHMHQLEKFNQYYGVKDQSGVARLKGQILSPVIGNN